MISCRKKRAGLRLPNTAAQKLQRCSAKVLGALALMALVATAAPMGNCGGGSSSAARRRFPAPVAKAGVMSASRAMRPTAAHASLVLGVREPSRERRPQAHRGAKRIPLRRASGSQVAALAVQATNR